MVLIPKNFGIAGSMGVLALNAVVGGLIGGVVLIIKVVGMAVEFVKIIFELGGKYNGIASNECRD